MDFTALRSFIDRLPGIGIPGMDCAVHLDGHEVFRHCAGYADRKTQIPMTGDRLYNLYSATKVITCAAALQLFERGAFLMTDPLYEYLPEFRAMNIRTQTDDGGETLAPARHPITIQDLFTMSAGLTYDLNSLAIRAVVASTGGKAPTREIIRAIAQDPLVFEPGTHWNYSLCHDVLGGLIEVVSGMGFGEYVRRNILDPLGMRDTGFRLPEEKLRRMASQYQYNDNTKTADEISTDNAYILGGEYESGGAGLISCADDYIRFADALANGGVGVNGAQILSRCTIDLMRTNCLDSARLQDFNWVQMSGYGYGLGVRTLIDKTKAGSLGSLGEFGWGGAAGVYVMIDPSRRLAVFYAQHMLNSLEPYVHPRIRNLVYMALDR